MGMGEAVRTVFKDKYATFSGRASRSEYWWSFLFLVIAEVVVAGVLFALAAVLGVGDDLATGGFSILMIVFVGLFFVFMLAVIIPMIAVTVRRLHDRNMSGWWYLGFVVLGLVPYVGFLATIALLVLMVLKGTEGDNRFGADPLQPGAAANVFA